MELNEIRTYIRNNLSSFLVFIAIFGSYSLYVFGEYKNVQAEKEIVYKLQVELKDKQLIFEKEKIKHEKHFFEKELKIAEMEKSINGRLADLKLKEKNLENTYLSSNKKDEILLAEKSKKLDDLTREYEVKLEAVSALHRLYSKEAQKVEAESKIQDLMSSYSELGVSLNSPDWCDKEYTKKYYQAEALLRQISAINSQHNVSDEYSWFVQRNSSNWVSSNSGVCGTNKHINPTPQSRAVD